MLVNDPQVPDAADPSKLDARTFNGAAMTYYGRWTYKFEEAARRGAAGALIVHEDAPGRLSVRGRAGQPRREVRPGHARQEHEPREHRGLALARRREASLEDGRPGLRRAQEAGDDARVQAGAARAQGVTGGQEHVAHASTRGTSSAKLEGSDPQLKDEYVIYTAHWDHFGIGVPVKGDKIYNGALDNASGVSSMLEMARALTKVKPAPKRSILFLAVTAEEQGLLGSQYYAVTPVYPLAKTLANINVDGINQWGRTKDITVIGLGASDSGRLPPRRRRRTEPHAPSGSRGREGFLLPIRPLQLRQAGRAGALHRQWRRIHRQADGYAAQKRDEYNKNDYHAPSDEIKPDWDLSGAVEDAELMAAVGYRVANADKFPEWKPGNEFRAKREGMLKK